MMLIRCTPNFDKSVTKCPVKSKPEIYVHNMRVIVCVKFNSWVTDFFFLWSIISRTLHDLPCLYSSSEAMLKLSQSARGHFVTLIEVGVQSRTYLNL